MSVASPDPVTSYLRQQSVEPEVARFESSDFVLGWRIRTTDFELVYRVDADVLVICDFRARDDAGDGNGAVMSFIRLVHRIERHVCGIASVRGMFVEPLWDPRLAALRRRLAGVLESQGSTWCEIDGDRWLVYPMTGRGRRPASARGQSGQARQ